jgi:hypothetical protein
LADNDLPVEEYRITFLDDVAKSAIFKAQFIFTPLVIRLSTRQQTPTISRMVRLPFECRLKDVGSGRYGKVDRVDIPAGYIINEDGRRWGHGSSSET